MHIVSPRSGRSGARAARRLIGSTVLVIAAGVLGGCAGLPSAEPTLPPGFRTDVDRYWAAVHDVCVRGVTSEMRSLYEAARQSVAGTGYGGGTSSNFWGIRGPEAFYQDCFQSPGWE